VEGYLKNGKPDVGYWLGEIRRGIAFRKRTAYETSWDLWRSYYRGNWKPGVMPSNIFFKYIRSVVPRVYFRNPSISVINKMGGSEGWLLSAMMEQTYNTLIRKIKLKQHMKRMVQDAWMFGTGVGKKGFGSQYQASPESFGDTQAPRVSRGKEAIEYNLDILPNMPWFLSSSPANYIVPDGTVRFEDRRWSAFQITRELNDVKSDPRLKHTSGLGTRGRQVVADGGATYLSKPTQECDLYEIRDIKTGKVFIISPYNTEQALLFEDDEYLQLGSRVESVLVFNEDDEWCWGVPDSKILEPQQLELNDIRTFQMYHRRISIVKLLAKTGAIDATEVDKLLGPDVAAVAWVKGDIQNSVQPLNVGDIPDGLIKAEEIITADVRETMGFSRNESGEYQGGSRARTAEEVRVVKMSSEIRIDERRDMIADMLVDLIETMNPIIFAHWSQEQVVKIVGPANFPIWVRFQPKMLERGQYEFVIDPDNSIPETKELREQKALQLYTVLKTNPLIDPFQLTQFLLHEMQGQAFDNMLRTFGQTGMPGMSAQNPLSFGEANQLVQGVGRQAPQAMPQRQPIAA